MCEKQSSLNPFDVVTHVGPRLVPFVKTVLLYYVAWLPLEYKSIIPAVIKCLPILCLIAFVGTEGVSLRKEHDYQRRVIVGLVFSCIGDALLIWDNQHFITAMIAFGIAHLAYIRAFGFSKFRWLKGIPFMGFVLFAMYVLYPGLQGFLLPAVFVYIWLVCSMGWRAFAQVDILENVWTWTRLCGCVGAILFMISDLMIGIDKFVTPIPLARVFIMSTYYAAQVSIALSAVNTDDTIIKLRLSSRPMVGPY